MRHVLPWAFAVATVLAAGSSAPAQPGRYIPPRLPGGGGGGFSPVHVPWLGRHGGAGDETAIWVLLAVLGLGVVMVLAWQIGKAMGGSQAGKDASVSDYVYPPDAVAERVATTTRLLERLAHHNPQLDPQALGSALQTFFLTVQQCWERRDYAPIQYHLGPEILHKHLAQLAAMREAGEVNRLVGLRVERLEVVHLNWQPTRRAHEVTALITFTAKSWYADASTGAYRRGPLHTQTFQELWVFQLESDTWVLTAIEMSRWSHRLWRPSEVEDLSEQGV